VLTEGVEKIEKEALRDNDALKSMSLLFSVAVLKEIMRDIDYIEVGRLYQRRCTDVSLYVHTIVDLNINTSAFPFPLVINSIDLHQHHHHHQYYRSYYHLHYYYHLYLVSPLQI